MYKIKVKSEDFIVEEAAGLPFREDGNFCVYLLKKRGWNTADVLKRLSKRFSIPYEDLSYGGKKDKYALTTQYITIARQHVGKIVLAIPPSFKGKGRKGVHKNADAQGMPVAPAPEAENLGDENYSLEFVGYMDRPMGPDLLKGNGFQIIVRNLADGELKQALREIERVRLDGYPNYFDDQRFGSFDARQGFIAEKILKKHYNGALKLYFSGIHPEDSKEEKEHRKFFYENWGNWQECLKGAASKFEKEAFRYLDKHPSGFVPILQRISHEKMVLFFSAYQSHLWNELLRKIVSSVVGNDATYQGFKSSGGETDLPLQHNTASLSSQGEASGFAPENPKTAGWHGQISLSAPCLKTSKGIAGDYLFYTQIDDELKGYLGSLVIPMPASNIRMPDAFTKTLYSEVLRDNGVKSAQFNIRKLRQAFFKGIERRAVVTPEDLFVDSAKDEIYHGKKKLVLRFALPRGCYGTMFIKRLFSGIFVLSTPSK